ncbi:MAG: alanine racemase [Patescibacteria group bacterium]|nr:alanine racemase [Patescibacteria group bacterium]
MKKQKTWVEVSKDNLIHNIQTLKGLVGDRVFCPAVKANAYGHGIVEVAPYVLTGGADWLAVDALFEAKKLKESGIESPIYIMGYVLNNELKEAVKEGFRFVVYNKETIIELGKISRDCNIHLKIETGNNRQGIALGDLPEIVDLLSKNPCINVEGVATHFADIEDTTDHSYAEEQIENFKKGIEILENGGVRPAYAHCANTAAVILFPHTYLNFVRAGIGIYGMWPSNETYVSAVKANKADIELRPALTWKTIIAQIKNLKEGEYIGYGRTYRTTHDTRLAVLPVGYYDGYDRGLSNNAFVIIHGKRAPVRGRVCMNMIMVDVTHIPEAKVEDEVILLGKDGGEKVSAELMGSWANTINYEITTRINERIPRVIV